MMPSMLENEKLDYKDIARRYVRTRAITFKLNQKLVGLLSKGIIQQAAKQIGILIKETIVFRNEDESSVLMDFAIHECRVDGKNAFDRYLLLNPPAPDSEEAAVFASVQRGYFSVFGVESVVPGFGVHVRDFVNNGSHFLADKGFSQTAEAGLVVASRVFPFADYLMTGGAGLPVNSATFRQIIKILPDVGSRSGGNEPRRNHPEFNAEVIRLCLSAVGAPKIRYQGVEEAGTDMQAEAFPRRQTGRNEPCPCGSGKKYKKCCGI